MVTKQMMTDDAHDDVVIVGVDKGRRGKQTYRQTTAGGANKYIDKQRPERQTTHKNLPRCSAATGNQAGAPEGGGREKIC